MTTASDAAWDAYSAAVDARAIFMARETCTSDHRGPGPCPVCRPSDMEISQ